MSWKNLFTLSIRVEEMSSVVKKPDLIKKLRKLTLNPYSGMNRELNHLLANAPYRPVNARVLLAYRRDQLIGWALMSKEETDFDFMHAGKYHPSDGILLEMFIDPKFRRQGIGTELMKVARRKAGPYRLCVAPWDGGSEAFYGTFKHYQTKRL